jgi:hypothetical protein
MPISLIARLGLPLEEFVLRVGHKRLDAVLFTNEALECADADWSIDGAATAAVLTGCGADPAANRGERVWRTCHQVRLLKFPFGNQLDVFARVCADWTSGLTRNHPFPELDVRHDRFVSGVAHEETPVRMD